MVTVAVALLVVSAADVAFTVKLVPAVVPAVKSPLVETVPPVAVQVTAVFELPVTVAVNCWVPPGDSVALVGEMVTLTPGWIVTCAVALLVVSAADVAFTVKLVPAVVPAVKRPLVETVPPVAVQVTAVFEL